MKTNAVRLLETLGIRYELREYEIDPEALEAETVARKIGLPPEQVFKTLVARGDRMAFAWQWCRRTWSWTKRRWRGSRAIGR